MSVEERLSAQLFEVRKELEAARTQLAARASAATSAELELAEKLQAEKQKRIEHTGAMAIKRIGKRDLSRGWQCWLDAYLEKRHSLNLLKASAARLARPKLAACVSAWRHSWDEAMQAAKLATLEGRMAMQIAQLTQELADARQAMVEGRGLEAELERQREVRRPASG